MSESYRPQIERSLRFIADHLDRPLTVAEGLFPGWAERQVARSTRALCA